MTKVDLISGFLGAGKTTLIKKLLEEVFSDEQVVLVENEYGEVGIDGGFLKDAGIEIRELNSGCICCTLVGDFSRALQEIITTYHPDRIIIEPSGVGKLSDVMASVKGMEEDYPEVHLNALVTVVNALKATKQMKAFGEFFNNQIESATTVVLSRTQSAKPEQLELCVKMVQDLNPRAAVITTPWDEISGQQILEVIEGQRSFMEELEAEVKASHGEEHDHEHHHHHHEHDHDHEEEHEHQHDHEHEHHHDHDHEEHDHEHEHHHDHEEHEHDHEHHHHHDHDGCCDDDHDADEVFTSWGRETPHKYTREKLEAILTAFRDTEEYGEVLRAKGMVPAEDGTWLYFDMVTGEYEIRTGDPEYTGRLCVIGTDIDEDRLEELFELV